MGRGSHRCGVSLGLVLHNASCRFCLRIKALPTPAAGFASLLRSPHRPHKKVLGTRGFRFAPRILDRQWRRDGWRNPTNYSAKRSSPVSRQDHPISQTEPGLVYPLTCHMIFILRSTTGSNLSAF